MSIPEIGYRRISILGENFRWTARKKRTQSFDNELEIPVRHINGGQLLIATLHLPLTAQYSHATLSIRVRDCIVRAVDLGWEFKKPGAPVYLVAGRLLHEYPG